MKVIRIDKNDWAEGIEKIRKTYSLIGPVKEKFYHIFANLGSGQMPDMEFTNSRISPKYIIYPQSEIILKCSMNAEEEDYKIYREPEDKEYKEKAVLGIRPCDADSLPVVMRNFDTDEYKDPYWLRAFETTTLVGLACDAPCPSCFCTSAGSGPYNHKNLDVMLIDNKDHYLAEIITEKGEKLAEAAGWQDKAEGIADEIAKRKSDAESKIESNVHTDNLAKQPLLDLYEATSIWEKAAFACINCGTCTYVCPTCWCFDIQDEVYGREGFRIRNWDSCMYPLFTLHASAHNPRGTKLARLRQRFMHKLKYYVDKYENGIQCTGCGRCVRLCPVNIDIRRICNMMNSYDPETCTCEATVS
ncbi:MAG: 4Fe-4S dicluster domain-containing protein [Desulfobacteraceae bacterium]|nr:4Fe-4S dicluster domain-containing protein [Desulfobacteraceae bacterium]